MRLTQLQKNFCYFSVLVRFSTVSFFCCFLRVSGVFPFFIGFLYYVVSIFHTESKYYHKCTFFFLRCTGASINVFLLGLRTILAWIQATEDLLPLFSFVPLNNGSLNQCANGYYSSKDASRSLRLEYPTSATSIPFSLKGYASEGAGNNLLP